MGKRQYPPGEHVYFIRCDGWLKIGMTKNLGKRLLSISGNNPRHVFILAYIAGGKELEKELHIRFRNHHARNEWFHCHKQIFDYIDEFATSATKGPAPRAYNRKKNALPTGQDAAALARSFDL